jgi:hypothetical protein
MNEIRIIVTVHRGANPWLYAETNFVQRHPEAREGPVSLTGEESRAVTVALELERSVRDAFTREVKTHGFDAALSIVKDTAARRATLAGFPIDVVER